MLNKGKQIQYPIKEYKISETKTRWDRIRNYIFREKVEFKTCQQLKQKQSCKKNRQNKDTKDIRELKCKGKMFMREPTTR